MVCKMRFNSLSDVMFFIVEPRAGHYSVYVPLSLRILLARLCNIVEKRYVGHIR